MQKRRPLAHVASAQPRLNCSYPPEYVGEKSLGISTGMLIPLSKPRPISVRTYAHRVLRHAGIGVCGLDLHVAG